MRKVLPLTLCLLLLAGCASTPSTAYPNGGPAYANPPASGESGVEGQVFIGPGCPVTQADTSCPDKPYQATLVIRNPQGEEILKVQTDVDGKFRIPLPSGKYVLHPETQGRYPTASDQEFTVTAGQFTQVIGTYDSGIR